MTPLEQKVREIIDGVANYADPITRINGINLDEATAAIMRLVEEEQSLARQMVWELEAQLTKQKEMVGVMVDWIKTAQHRWGCECYQTPHGELNEHPCVCGKEALTAYQQEGK